MEARLEFGRLFRRPSAFLPIAMSFAALAVLLIHVARFGAAREADEGTPRISGKF